MGSKNSKADEDGDEGRSDHTHTDDDVEAAAGDAPPATASGGDAVTTAADTVYTPPPPPEGLRYQLRGPSRRGQVTACFREGFLFRITNGRVWYFYNDTTKFEMHVTIRFGPDSRLTALKTAQLSREPDGWIVVHAVIYPSETVPFCKGVFKAFSSDVAAKPLSSGYRERLNLATEKDVQRSLDAVIQLAHGRTKVDQILSSCVLQQVPFVDMSFPPTAAALSAPVGPVVGDDGGVAGADTPGLIHQGRVKHTLPRTAWHRPKDFIAREGRRDVPERPAVVFVPPPASEASKGRSRRGSTASVASSALAPTQPPVVTTNGGQPDPSPPATSQPNAVVPREPGIFITPVSPNDIVMGELGDTALLGAAAALAEVPSRIQSLFCLPPGHDVMQGKREQAVGAYRVTVNVDGWWATRIVDDYLPCIAGQPCFARNASTSAELWAGLLEKAYAKAHGSYAAIIGGDVMHALTDLTGFPSFRVDSRWASPATVQYMISLSPLRRDGSARNKIRTPIADMVDAVDASLQVCFTLAGAVHSGHIVVLNTPSSVTAAALQIHEATSAVRLEECYDSAGLRLGQSYAVLDTKSFPAIGVHLLRIRNPWPDTAAAGSGRRRWQGNWSDNSKAWSTFPSVATSCGVRMVDDGTFWMDWTDVQRYFDGAAICCVTPNLKHDYRVRGNFNNGYPNLALEVLVTAGRPVDAIISISQRDKRSVHRSNSAAEAKYSAVMVTVCRPSASKEDRHEVHKTTTEDPTKPSDGFNFLYGRDVSLMYRFEPSPRPYLVVPRAFDAGATKPYTLALITDRLVDGDQFRVRFRFISPTCNVYSNYSNFHYAPSYSSEVEADYQYRNADDGVPCNARGSELTSERHHHGTGALTSSQGQQGHHDAPPPLRGIGSAAAAARA